MKFLQILFLLFFVSANTDIVAQSVYVSDRSDFDAPRDASSDVFDLIADNSSRTGFNYIATVECTSKYLDDCFTKIERRAERLGANAFEYSDYYYSEGKDKETLVLKLYYGNQQIIADNYGQFDNKEIAIFSDSYAENSFRVNDQTIILPPDNYYATSIGEMNQSFTRFRIQELNRTYMQEDSDLPKYILIEAKERRRGGRGGGIFISTGRGGLVRTIVGTAILTGISRAAGGRKEIVKSAVRLPQNYALLLKQIRARYRP